MDELGGKKVSDSCGCIFLAWCFVSGQQFPDYRHSGGLLVV
jgi:hypothetical protein